MPLITRRRSTLDVLLDDVRNARDQDRPPPNSPAAADGVPLRQRPSTAQPVSESLSRAETSRPASPPIQDATPATRRFSMMRWRHFSDTQLAATARAHAAQEDRPPMPHMAQPTTTGKTASRL